MKSSMSWQSNLLSKSLLQPQPRQNLGARLNNLWQRITSKLTAAEPHVWTTQDKTGQTHWRAYDPITSQSVDFVTEEAMRIWLEERHYQYHLAA